MRGYPPEFRNRIDRIVCFTELGDDELIKVVDIELKTFNSRVLSLPKEKIFVLSVDHSAKLFFARQKESSPRPSLVMRKSAIPAMQQAMKALLSEPTWARLVRRGVIHGGDRVEVSHKEGDDKFTFEVFADPIHRCCGSRHWCRRWCRWRTACGRTKQKVKWGAASADGGCGVC